MPPPVRVPLVQGAYTARNVIAAAQRSLNLYPERDPEGEDSPVTHYPTPGLTRLGVPAQANRVRGLYRATNEGVYAAVGNGVYYVSPNWTTTFLGRMGIAWGTDLVIHPSDIVSSATYNFVTDDIGNFVQIMGGTGFIPGEYEIVGVASGQAALGASPGANGSTGGDWNLVQPAIAPGPDGNNIRTCPVKMQDNGVTMVIVDGSSYGWTVDIDSHAYARIVDPNFFGSNFVEIIDTIFLFNKPNSNIWYISPSNYTVGPNGTDLVIEADGSVTSASYTFLPTDVGGTLNITAGTGFLVNFYIITSVSLGAATLDTSPGTPGSTGGTWSLGQAFDPLSYAAKTGYPDLIAGITAQNRNAWIIGAQMTAEIWYHNAAATITDFAFAIIDGPFIEHGCIARYSIANVGGVTFWLSQNLGGTSYVVMGANLASQRISNEAIEAAIGSYPVITDAVGFVYTEYGHTFYWLKFPTQGIDWVYDLTTKQWHERGHLKVDCTTESSHVFCSVYAHGINVVGDSETGQLYWLNIDDPTDNGDFIERRRGWPHMMVNGNRASYPSFVADVQAGTVTLADDGSALFMPGTNRAVVTVIRTTFTAPNQTLLQDYFSTDGYFPRIAGDIGSQYSQIDFTTSAVIVGNVLTGVGQTEYLAAGKPTSADYIAQFQAIPASVGVAANGKQLFLVGRANASNNGYKMIATSDGSVYQVKLTVMGAGTTTVAMGLLTSGFFQLYLSMQGAAIDVAVQRSEDDFWLRSDASWGASFDKAISITDTTYTTAGNVLIGGIW